MLKSMDWHLLHWRIILQFQFKAKQGDFLILERVRRSDNPNDLTLSAGGVFSEKIFIILELSYNLWYEYIQRFAAHLLTSYLRILNRVIKEKFLKNLKIQIISMEIITVQNTNWNVVSFTAITCYFLWFIHFLHVAFVFPSYISNLAILELLQRNFLFNNFFFWSALNLF